MLGYPPCLRPWPSSHVPVVLRLVFTDCLSTGPGPDKEKEEKVKLGLHSACLVLCFSASGCCWQGRGEVTLCFWHMGVCEKFEENGVRKGCVFPCPRAEVGDSF